MDPTLPSGFNEVYSSVTFANQKVTVSMVREQFSAAVSTEDVSITSSKDNVNVYADEPVFETTILVMIAVVDAGTVYKVVLVVVVEPGAGHRR